MPHAQLMPRSNGAAVRGSRLKIATDVAGILELSKAPSGRHFCITPLYFPTFLWPYNSLASTFLEPLHFSGPYISLATTFLWPLLFSSHYLSLAPVF